MSDSSEGGLLIEPIGGLARTQALLIGQAVKRVHTGEPLGRQAPRKMPSMDAKEIFSLDPWVAGHGDG